MSITTFSFLTLATIDVVSFKIRIWQRRGCHQTERVLVSQVMQTGRKHGLLGLANCVQVERRLRLDRAMTERELVRADGLIVQLLSLILPEPWCWLRKGEDVLTWLFDFGFLHLLLLALLDRSFLCNLVVRQDLQGLRRNVTQRLVDLGFVLDS